MCVCVYIRNSCSSDGKASVCNAGDLGSIPGSGRSPGKGICVCMYAHIYSCVCIHMYIYVCVCIDIYPGEGNSNPLQYCCLEDPMDREAW